MARRTLKDDPFPTEGSKGFAPWVARRLEGRSDLERFQLAARATLRSFPFLRTLPNILPAAPLREPRDHLLSVIRCFPILGGVSFARFTDINRFRRHGADARISIDDEIVNTSGIAHTATRVVGAVAHLALVVPNPDAGISIYPGDYPLAAVTWFHDAAISDKLAPYLGAAFEQDCRLLDSIGLTALACHRLWPDWDEEVAEAFLPLMPADHGFDPSPKAFREELARFIPQLRDLPGDFLVWVEWYDGIVRGSRNGRYLFGLPTGDMFDPAVGTAEGTALRLNLDIAMIDNALWKGDPAELHAEIRRLVEVARGEGRRAVGSKEEEASEEDIPTIPAQALGPQFGAVDERLELIESADEEERPAKRGQTLLDELRDTFDDLASAMNPHNGVPNDHPKLRKLLTRYGAVVHLDNPDPELIFVLGLRLEEALSAAKREIATRDQPELEDEAKSALESLVRLNAIFVATSESGKELLDAAERYAYSRAGDDQFRKAAESVVKKMDIDAIATEKAIDIIKGAVEGINTGTHPHRQGLVAKNTVGNAVSYLGNAAVEGVVGNATFEIIKVGGGAAFVAASTDITVKAVQFFVANAPELAALVQASPESLGWVTHLIRWIRMRLKL